MTSGSNAAANAMIGAGYLVNNPSASLTVAIALFVLCAVGFTLRIYQRIGKPYYLVPAPILWMLNSIWELTGVGKVYDSAYDIKFLYPALAWITFLLTMVWLYGAVLGIVRAADQNDDKVPYQRISEWGGERIWGIIPKIPLESLKNNWKMIAAGAGFFFFLVFIFFAAGTRSISGGLFYTAVSVTIVLTFIVICFGLYWLGMRFGHVSALRAEVEAQVKEMESYVNPLGENVRKFETLAVSKFHAITKEANAYFIDAQRIHKRMEERLKAVHTMMEEGGEPAYEATKELLKTELDVRESFVDGLVLKRGEQFLDPPLWKSTAEQHTKRLGAILRVLESAPDSPMP